MVGFKNIFTVLLLVVSSFLIGTLGYHLIEGWSLFDSFYMAIITLTTVGFSEVHNLSENGRIFTTILLVFGLGIVTYSITEFMNIVLNFDLNKHRRLKMIKSAKLLENHTIVCGFGRMGTVVCQELAQSDTKFIVIEKDPVNIKQLEKTSYQWIEGDASNEDILELAKVSKAKVLVSMVDSDADALYIALVGRSISKDLFIMCRATEEHAKKRILRAGANKVVQPTRMTAMRVAECVLNPAVEDFLDISGERIKDGKRIQLADLFVTKESDLYNQTLGEKGREMDELIIVGIRKSDKTFLFKPAADYRFQEGDCIIAMGSSTSYNKAKDHFNLDSVTPF